MKDGHDKKSITPWNCVYCNRYIQTHSRVSHVLKHRIKGDKPKFEARGYEQQ